jgi:hypothetical protein
VGQYSWRCLRDLCRQLATPLSHHTRRVGQARYHLAIEETPEWAYLGEPLSPLKGFPGVVWDRSRRKPRVTPISRDELVERRDEFDDTP